MDLAARFFQNPSVPTCHRALLAGILRPHYPEFSSLGAWAALPFLIQAFGCLLFSYLFIGLLAAAPGPLCPLFLLLLPLSHTAQFRVMSTLDSPRGSRLWLCFPHVYSKCVPLPCLGAAGFPLLSFLFILFVHSPFYARNLVPKYLCESRHIQYPHLTLCEAI